MTFVTAATLLCAACILKWAWFSDSPPDVICYPPLDQELRDRNGRPEGFAEKEAAPEGAAKFSNAQCTNCRASATSTESPSWLRTSNPDSGTSPDVLWDTMIFLAISPRQVICEELA